jgi:hypothetical protein
MNGVRHAQQRKSLRQEKELLTTDPDTANSDGDPVVAVGGALPLANRLKQIHQRMDTVSLFRPI